MKDGTRIKVKHWNQKMFPPGCEPAPDVVLESTKCNCDASHCLTSASSRVQVNIPCSEFCGYQSKGCSNKWNKQQELCEEADRSWEGWRLTCCVFVRFYYLSSIYSIDNSFSYFIFLKFWAFPKGGGMGWGKGVGMGRGVVVGEGERGISTPFVASTP